VERPRRRRQQGAETRRAQPAGEVGVFVIGDQPGIEDLAPTALELFGVTPPPYMEGKSLFKKGKPVEREAAA